MNNPIDVDFHFPRSILEIGTLTFLVPGSLALLCCSRSANNLACMSPISRLMSLITQRIYTIYALLLQSYPTAVVVSDVPGSGTRVHTPAHGRSEAHNNLPDSILLNEPKPLKKHRPPPL
ncbi:hypothetical protein Tco_0801189 [Tanacetum coccineum]|uniref:Uncharacterized protein n=1 Tax=Tanacetum coccineum TaxID=301880 RepID=A0ABQ4ZY57_9ASTR